MLMKRIALTFLALFSLYSVETNAGTIKGNTCTIGVLPLGNTMVLADKKQEILSAFEERGFFPTELDSPRELANFEFIADASVDCQSTYFGTLAKTTLRLVEAETNKIVSRVQTPGVMDLFTCRVEILKAISALPICSIK